MFGASLESDWSAWWLTAGGLGSLPPMIDALAMHIAYAGGARLTSLISSFTRANSYSYQLWRE
jgi:hypothetical protein